MELLQPIRFYALKMIDLPPLQKKNIITNIINEIIYQLNFVFN